MAERRTPIEELARSEAAAAKRRAEQRAALTETEARIADELPAQFFAMAADLRVQADRFNRVAGSARALRFEASPAVTTRDLDGDLHVALERSPSRLSVALRAMARSGRSDAYLIEGYGSIGAGTDATRFLLRVSGVPRNRLPFYIVTCNGRRLDRSLEDLPSALALTIAEGSLTPLLAPTSQEQEVGRQKVDKNRR